MKKKQKPSGVLVNFMSVIIGMIIVVVFVSLSPLAERLYMYCTPVELPPARLVDHAMSLPGAIVISPHRDLSTIGTGFGSMGNLHVGGPAIAVRTSNWWCVWSLGDVAATVGVPSMTNEAYEDAVTGLSYQIIGSSIGYQKAYDRFMECVRYGNPV